MSRRSLSLLTRLSVSTWSRIRMSTRSILRCCSRSFSANAGYVLEAWSLIQFPGVLPYRSGNNPRPFAAGSLFASTQTLAYVQLREYAGVYDRDIEESRSETRNVFSIASTPQNKGFCPYG